jgi:ribonuclease VapC
MVIDSSAIVAVLQQEPEARVFADAIASDRIRLVSAVSALESAMVVESRYGPSGARELYAFILTGNIEIVPLNAEQLIRRTAPVSRQ